MLLRLLALLVVLAFPIAALLRRRRGPRRGPPPPPPPTPPAPSIDCGYPTVTPAPTAASPQVLLTATDRVGTFSGSSVQLPAATTIDLSGDLTIVASQGVTIDGYIRCPNDVSVNISIVSLNGDVVVTGGMGDGRGSPGTSSSGVAPAVGGDGGAGGTIKLIAERGRVRVDGTVLGQQGGHGGTALANGAFGANVIATSGKGGPGGAVVLCALEGIEVTGLGVIEGGRG